MTRMLMRCGQNKLHSIHIASRPDEASGQDGCSLCMLNALGQLDHKHLMLG